MCERTPCPEVSCLHPAEGECCLECEKCGFSGKIYANGENFTNPNNPCESCLCTVKYILIHFLYLHQIQINLNTQLTINYRRMLRTLAVPKIMQRLCTSDI